MGLLSNLFRPMAPQKLISIGTELGNVAVIGNSKAGKEEILRNYALDAYNKNAAVFWIRNAAAGMSVYPAISTSPNAVFAIDNSEDAMTEQFNAFAHCSTDADRNSALIKLFDAYSPIDPMKKMNYQSYIDIVCKLLKAFHKQTGINEFYNYSIEDIDNLNRRAPIPQTDRDRNERFLNGFRSDAMGIESYFRAFSTNSGGFIMSGTKSLEKIFQVKDFLEVSLDFNSKQPESEMLLSIFIDNIKKTDLSSTQGKDFIVVADEIPNESLINSGFIKLLKMPNCHIIFTVSDISNLTEKSNDWIEAADSYFFLRQNSNKNKDFCADFFGKYEKQKVSDTMGESNQKPSFFGFGLIDPDKTTVSRNRTISYEKEYTYPPEVFASLGDYESIYYFKNGNEHNRLNLR